MKIEINIKLVFLIIILFLINNVNTYLIFFVSILLHELSHLIIGIIIGKIPQKMNVSIFGVSLEFYSYSKNKVLNKCIFYIIGPITNLIIAYIFYYFLNQKNFSKEIIITNILLFVFNMLPILPLDGGKILREILCELFGVCKGNKISIEITKLILIVISLSYSVLILKVKNISVLFLIIYLWYLYVIENKKYMLYLKTKECIENII